MAVKQCSEEMQRPHFPHWRVCARLAATLANSGMVLYIYAAHLLGVEWGSFGRGVRGGASGSSLFLEAQHESLLDYVWGGELDPAFDKLRDFTFSEAMLQNINTYMLVGTPVAAVFFFLEHDRIRWLQALVAERMPRGEAERATWWLEFYLRCVVAAYFFVLALAPCHLEMPRVHYFCAAGALSFGITSVSVYLYAPVDYTRLGQTQGETSLAAWTSRVQRWVRPALKLVIGLHFAAGAAAIWKARRLGDDHAALLFGVLETAVVLSYQLWQGVFVVDDAMVHRKPTAALAAPRWHSSNAALSPRGGKDVLAAKPLLNAFEDQQVSGADYSLGS